MKKYLAEAIGTFSLVLIGCGSAVIAGQYMGTLGVAFAFGITVLVMAYAIGPISGCHVNPAVTFAMFLTKKMSFQESVSYIVAQIIGAIVGAWVLLQIASGAPGYDVLVNGLGQNGFGEASLGSFGKTAALWTEIIFTALFIFVILAVTHKNAHTKFAGIAIGLMLFLIHVVTIPVTGTSVNPARSIGPALFAGDLAMSQLWLFIVAPLIGAALGALVWQGLMSTKND